MPERTKPPTPSLETLRSEVSENNVTLPGKKEMRDRLLKVIRPEDRQAAEEQFIPLLLEHAGKSVRLDAVPAIIVQAVHTQLGEGENFRFYASQYFHLFVNALVDNPAQRERAYTFLQSALSG